MSVLPLRDQIPSCTVEQEWDITKEKIDATKTKVEVTHEAVMEMKSDFRYLEDIARQLGLVHEEAKLMRESLVGPATSTNKTVTWLVGGMIATLGVLLVVLILKDSNKDFVLGGQNGVHFTSPR